MLRNEINEQSMTARPAGMNGCGKLRGGQMARIGFFHDNDPAVLPEFPGELPPANVHGKNPRGAVLQQAIGESAGGRAQVKRRQSGDIQLKMAAGRVPACGRRG